MMTKASRRAIDLLEKSHYSKTGGQESGEG